MNISQNGLNLIKQFEGCSLIAYRDSVGVLTIGYGHTAPDIIFGERITQQHADLLLSLDLQAAASCVNRTGVGFNQNQFDALCSFTFNLGCGALKMLLSHGLDQVPTQMLRWDHAGGGILPGLQARRSSEAKLFVTPDESPPSSADFTKAVESTGLI